MTASGIERATFRFVAQHLNHCATVVPFYIYIPVCTYQQHMVIHHTKCDNRNKAALAKYLSINSNLKWVNTNENFNWQHHKIYGTFSQ